MTRGRLAVVAELQNFYSAGLADMLQREVGFAEVIRVYDYITLVDVLTDGEEPDFLALDTELPGIGGIASVAEIRALRPTMRIAVFSDQTEMQDILSVLAAGAHGFIPRQSTNCAELLRALKIVEEMGVFVPANLLGPRIVANEEGEAGSAASETLATLTERQQQVIRLLSEGHANKVIARELGISPSTVKVHVHAAFRTLGVHSRLAATAALHGAPRALPNTLRSGVRHAISS